MSKIRLMAIGGQDERGKNMFVLEINDEWFILDAGVKYPDKGILGVDIVIPKLDYIFSNKKKIKGIFLTNSASYNMGAVPYILKNMDVPVYCNEITQLISKIKISRMRIKNHKDQNYKVIKDKDIINVGKIKVEVFRTTSASPQSFGYAFHTELGVVVYAGDYIIDGKEQSYFSTDFNHLSDIGKKNVLALIADSEYASRHGFTVPNHKISDYIAIPFKDQKTRIAIGIFEEDIFKLGEICRAAKENNRKIAVYGRLMTEVLKSNLISENLKLLPEDIISINEYMASDNAILIISGTVDVLYSKLTKIATGNDDVIELSDKDTIILATPPAPGVEKKHAQILDELARTDAKLIALSDRNIWTMHASYEDVKVLTSIINPKYFIPVKSLFKDALQAEAAAMEAGVLQENIVIINNGQVVDLSRKVLTLEHKSVDNGNAYVDEIGIGDVGAIVLNERRQLATDGVIILGATIDSRSKALVSMIDTQMRGVLYIQEDNPIFRIIQKEIELIIEQGEALFKAKPNKYDLNEIKKDILNKVKALIKQESGKQPIILAIINEFNGSDFVFKKRSTHK